MSRISLREFRPTIIFLVKFLCFYVIGNILYGLYVTAYNPKPDPATHVVSSHSAFILNACGMDVSIRDHAKKPNTWILRGEHPVLAVYEGCNGLNTMVIFLAFVLAFGPVSKRMIWFIPLGLLIIHLTNLGRITLLFYVSEYMPQYMYFTHKYFFTGILYLVIFLLWLWWINKISIVKKSEG